MLQPTIYEYRRVDNEAFEHPQARSVTTYSSQDKASAFRASLLVRHPECIVSGQSYLSVTHLDLIPRRLGDIEVQAIFQRFTGLSFTVTRYHASIGLPLDLYAAVLVDTFQGVLGHRKSRAPFDCILLCCIDRLWILRGRYQVHVFLDNWENVGLHCIDRLTRSYIATQWSVVLIRHPVYSIGIMSNAL